MKASELSGAQKTWLANQILHRHSTAPLLALRFGLCRKLLASYARTIRKGGILLDSGGRPPKLSPKLKIQLRRDVM